MCKALVFQKTARTLTIDQSYIGSSLHVPTIVKNVFFDSDEHYNNEHYKGKCNIARDTEKRNDLLKCGNLWLNRLKKSYL